MEVEVERDKITLTKTTPPEKETSKTISEKSMSSMKTSWHNSPSSSTNFRRIHMVDYVVDITQEQYNSYYMTLMNYYFKDSKINVEIYLDYFKKDKLGIDENKILFSINEKDIEVFERYLKYHKLKFVRLENYNDSSFVKDEPDCKSQLENTFSLISKCSFLNRLFIN